MELTLQDGLCDNLQPLAPPGEDCHADGRLNDNHDRICAGVEGRWQPAS